MLLVFDLCGLVFVFCGFYSTWCCCFVFVVLCFSVWFRFCGFACFCGVLWILCLLVIWRVLRWFDVLVCFACC